MFKMVLMSSLFLTQHKKVGMRVSGVRIRDRSGVHPYLHGISFWKRSLRVASDYSRPTYLLKLLATIGKGVLMFLRVQNLGNILKKFGYEYVWLDIWLLLWILCRYNARYVSRTSQRLGERRQLLLKSFHIKNNRLAPCRYKEFVFFSLVLRKLIGV